MTTTSRLFVAVMLVAIPSGAHAQSFKFDAATISGIAARNIGSATMSGRIAAVDAVDESGRVTLFVGSASGGVWKSINGGTTFDPVFDHQPVQSIGAVTIDRSNPKVVWVGTGESWTRNSVSIGDGIYKSVDGGTTWTNVGLRDTERIAKILVDPRNGNNVLACAVGPLWSDSDARGVYKTTDGGATWRKVLAGANPSTGCGMLAANPSAPSIVYADMWDVRRKGWTFRSGGPGSGLFKSTDGGEHWTELTASTSSGLPAKPYGRIALAVAPSKPDTIYAMIESTSSALFRSDDAGKTWNRLDASQFVVWRPFYFANLIVDPKNDNKIFKPDLNLLLSVDGGRSFTNASGSAHGDFHDVWIDPGDPNIVIAGDDGGLWRSNDGGTRWKHFLNLPVSQFYHVSTDDANPYHVFGGLQDNSTWIGDSTYPGGITNSRWENLYNGDGQWVFPDPADSNYVYAEYQGGQIARVNRRTLLTRSIKPYARYGEKRLRFNWTTPLALSPNERGTIYMGSQYLLRSRDHGQSWQRISPDLTTNDPEKQKQEQSGGVTVDNSAAEMHTTIYSISESPRDRRLIWVGTDDGNVQLTRDGGRTWANVVGRIRGLPRYSWVSSVHASQYAAGTAYATFDRHTFGDMRPYAYRTNDFGRTWQTMNLSGNGVTGYAHVITEDTANRNLLFLGTEFGLWISYDGGNRWAQYRGSGFPAVAVRDIVVQPHGPDLVLATHGRGIWIIDDISPWRVLTSGLMARNAALVPGKPALQYLYANGGWPEGDETYNGPSRPGDAFITYYQKSRHIFGDLKFEIFDQRGHLVDTLGGSTHRGLNRVTWPMVLKPPIVVPAATALFQAAQGPRVMPGTYTVKMTKGNQVYTERLQVALDPRAPYSVRDRAAQFALAMRLYGLLNHMSFGVAAIEGVRDAAMADLAQLAAGDVLRTRLQQLSNRMNDLRSRIVATKEGGAITGEERIREYLGDVYGAVVNQYEGRPTNEQVARAAALARQLDDVVRDFHSTTAAQLPSINAELKQKNLPPIVVISENEWRKQHLGSDGATVSGTTTESIDRF
ncbi:MAG: sialidase [Candidatus Eremiobacteraeota bacterium]|nr:sialidase [Candidatus Eremiobacteraeota bacterium]